ncbi:MAG: peptidylprolyl isomerase [Lachnospira sp.]|nr:peptidylprolyl isomerase [Lachnospira sp.]
MTSMKQYLVPTLVGLLVIGVIIAILIITTNPKDEKEADKDDKKTETVAGVGTYYADIVIEDYGTIVVELDGDAAPITVANFVKLAKGGFYDGLTFHRIIEGFMMQGGAPKDAYSQAETIKGEFSANGYENNLKHTRGAISMARSNAYNSASSQFFIMHKDAAHLDGNYAAFGYVTQGMDVVDKVCESAKPTDNNGSIASDKQPVIKSITIRQ